MIPVPSKRLLVLAVFLMPLGLIEVIKPGLGILLLIGIALLAVFSLADLFLSVGLLKSLRVTVEPLTRLARGVEGKLLVYLECESEVPESILLGLPLSSQFSQLEDTQQVRLSGDGVQRWVVIWTLTARSRGIYPCPDVYAEVHSRWKLFQIRRAYPVEGEIRVYPNMRRERKQLANLFLNRGDLGVHAQRMVGQGREYEQLREYSAGDNMLDIHWKASAKRGELVTKTYQIERTQEIYFIIDHSRLSGLRTRETDMDNGESLFETILERYVTAASILSMVAQREGDRFGLVAFGKQVSRFVRAGGGKQHAQVIQNALFDLRTEWGPFDLDELFSFLRLRLRRRALLIFMTDLNDAAAAEEFQRHVPMVAGQHLVLVNSIGRAEVRPVYEGGVVARSLPDEIAGHMRWESMRQLQGKLRAQGVGFSVLDDEKLSLELVNQYISVKHRQVL